MKQAYTAIEKTLRIFLLEEINNPDTVKQYFLRLMRIGNNDAWLEVLGYILEEPEFAHLKIYWQKINILA